MSDCRLYGWEDGRLYFRVDNEFFDADIAEAARCLPRPALACLSSKLAVRVHVPNEWGVVIMSAESDRDAERCVELMEGYFVDFALKWSEGQDGGSMFFKPNGGR